MKNFIKYFAAGACALSMASCLDLSPKDQLSDPDLWDKPGDFESFANKFYDWMPNFDRTYGDWHADKSSDLLLDKGATNVLSNGTNTIPQSDGDYTGSYDHIRRCNLLIEKAAGYSNQDEIRQSLGEAYFWRAWNHFTLVQKFGDAIIVDKTIDVDDPRMNAKRNDRGEVVNFIIEDLNKAVSLMKSTSEIDEGRVGKEGAQAFLSRVALYEGTWQKFRGNEERGKSLCDIAAKAAKAVMNSGKFELFAPVTLGDSAQKYMFILEDVQCNPAGLNKSANKEYILKRCYHATLKTTGKNLTTEVLANAQYVAAKFVDMYLCSDGLPIDKSPL
ncbi:MAG: RagB/SusD family nutrient uptake outer membrane protein, partial [Muribaculaceae bacterium]|nr:RagB/SusD family nutrient uptake outer membrane protein [Muribaculaceae bacterium]